MNKNDNGGLWAVIIKAVLIAIAVRAGQRATDRIMDAVDRNTGRVRR